MDVIDSWLLIPAMTEAELTPDQETWRWIRAAHSQTADDDLSERSSDR